MFIVDGQVPLPGIVPTNDGLSSNNALIFITVTHHKSYGALGDLLVVSAYKLPQTELLSNDLEAAFGAHRRVVLAGDLNCNHPHWGLSLIHI